MNVNASFAQRVALTGLFAVAVAAGPLVGAVFGPATTGIPLAECPEGQSLDPLTGTCHPSSQAPLPVTDPINPEGAQLQPGSLTGTLPGEVGRLPEVNGIPCTGSNTGQCIGLSENNNQFGPQN